MNEELKKLLEAKYNKQIETRIKSDQSISLRAIEDGDTKTIKLVIKTNSWSPVYGNMREKIGPNAFDDSLRDVESGNATIYSFADHKRDTDNILTSTSREETKLYKDDNSNYVLEFKVDEDNEKSRNIYDQIKRGDITGNSFIFIPTKTTYKKARDDATGKDIIEVTIERGKLMSIDPVVFPFYTQNLMEARSRDFQDINIEHTVRKEINMREFLLGLIKARSITIENIEKAPDTELFTAIETHSRSALETKLKDLTDEVKAKEIRSSFDSDMTELRKTIEGENKSSLELRNEIKLLKEKDATTKIDATVTSRTFIRGDYWIRKSLGADGAVKILNDLRELNTRTIDEQMYTEKEVEIMNIQTRDFTGADADTGSQVIPVVMDSIMIKDGVFALPEVEGSRRIPLKGEESIKYPINIIPAGAATRKGRGADSDEIDVNAVTMLVTGQPFSEDFSYNPRMQAHVAEVPADTLNLQNRHKHGMRKEFATTIVQHKAVTFASLKGNDPDKSNYEGGITSDGIVETNTELGFAMADFDGVTDKLVAKYGQAFLTANFRWYMNSKSWGLVKELARASVNDSTIRIDLKAMRINEIPVILNDDFAEDAATAGDVPFILYQTSNVRTFGMFQVIRDSDQQKWKARKNTRQVTTWGDVRLADPHYTTRGLKIKAKA